MNGALKLLPAGVRDRSRILQMLNKAWRADGMPSKNFPEFEAALVRYEAMSRTTENGHRDVLRRQGKFIASEARE
jgi:hypothetical protein